MRRMLVAAVGLAVLSMSAPTQVSSQSSSSGAADTAPACAENRSTTGRAAGEERERMSLSERLARSNGVICPPETVDPRMNRPAPGGGRMPVIPPPGSPRGDPNVQPR